MLYGETIVSQTNKTIFHTRGIMPNNKTAKRITAHPRMLLLPALMGALVAGCAPDTGSSSQASNYASELAAKDPATTIQDIYKSREDCVKDWIDEQLCSDMDSATPAATTAAALAALSVSNPSGILPTAAAIAGYSLGRVTGPSYANKDERVAYHGGSAFIPNSSSGAGTTSPTPASSSFLQGRKTALANPANQARINAMNSTRSASKSAAGRMSSTKGTISGAISGVFGAGRASGGGG